MSRISHSEQYNKCSGSLSLPLSTSHLFHFFPRFRLDTGSYAARRPRAWAAATLSGQLGAPSTGIVAALAEYQLAQWSTHLTAASFNFQLKAQSRSCRGQPSKDPPAPLTKSCAWQWHRACKGLGKLEVTSLSWRGSLFNGSSATSPPGCSPRIGRLLQMLRVVNRGPRSPASGTGSLSCQY